MEYYFLFEFYMNNYYYFYCMINYWAQFLPQHKIKLHKFYLILLGLGKVNGAYKIILLKFPILYTFFFYDLNRWWLPFSAYFFLDLMMRILFSTNFCLWWWFLFCTRFCVKWLPPTSNANFKGDENVWGYKGL